ncbi:hypothetical protein [Comamonas sp. lk]|uniref:hypothetical protein n=1 Tax=Comamonas sp. lk TaxID=2201272 RepID=UPI000EB3927C|nr:hypothetical protein [Comamonas sp. lk]
MKVIIQTLKAPWPEGAKVGDVVSFEAETAPAWAVGKFTLAPENAEALFRYQPKLVENQAVNELQVRQERDFLNQSQLADQEETIRQLTAELKEGVAESSLLAQQLDAAKSDLEASLAREANLQGIVTDAQKMDEALAQELEKVRAQVAELQAQATTKTEAEPKPETKTAKK